MLRHLLKLIWKRKSRNLMLSLEILLAFLVLFAIAAFGLRYYQLQQMPIGYTWQDRWTVNIRAAQKIPNDAAIYDQLRRGLLAMPEIEHVAFSSFAPYTRSRWTTEATLADGSQRTLIDSLGVSDDFFATMNMRLLAGRWFSHVDDGADATPVVVNRRLAEKLFPGRPALGQVYVEAGSKDKPQRFRVTGVVEEFRSMGDYMSPAYFMLQRFVPGVDAEAAQTIVIQLRPGTARAFENQLNIRLKQIRNDWSYVIAPLAESRQSMLASELIGFKILAVLAAFLLVMVAFGLFGVLWQNTTRRIPEIGLRRALGADAGAIYRQIIAEQFLLSSAAMALALLLLVQLPLTGVMGERLNWSVFCGAVALSAAVIYLLSLLCSLYPGWRAARLSPTQALHYE